MTRPQITRSDMEALYAFAGSNNLTGMVQVRCVITVKGDLERCRVEKPVLPSELDLKVAEVIERHWKAKPATLRGQPVAVDYVLHLNFRGPPRPPPPTPVAPPN